MIEGRTPHQDDDLPLVARGRLNVDYVLKGELSDLGETLRTGIRSGLPLTLSEIAAARRTLGALETYFKTQKKMTSNRRKIA